MTSGPAHDPLPAKPSPRPTPTAGTVSQPSVGGPNVDKGAGGTEADRLRAEILETRQELGDTVDALSAKLDVKSRVDDKKTEVTDQVKAKANEGVEVAKANAAKLQNAATDDQGKPLPAVLGGAGAAAVVLVLLLIRRRRVRSRLI